MDLASQKFAAMENAFVAMQAQAATQEESITNDNVIVDDEELEYAV